MAQRTNTVNKFWLARIGDFLTTFKVRPNGDWWQCVFQVPPDLENRSLGYLMVLVVQGNKAENIPFLVEYMSSFRDDIPLLTIISREELYTEYSFPSSMKIGTIMHSPSNSCRRRSGTGSRRMSPNLR